VQLDDKSLVMAGGTLVILVESFVDSRMVLSIDTAALKATVVKNTSNGIIGSDYEVSRVEFKSKDGTLIPMFIIHQEGNAKGWEAANRNLGIWRIRYFDYSPV
jgi:prolyl oligopeptidase PreP (S9A serine peptidase family)